MTFVLEALCKMFFRRSVSDPQTGQRVVLSKEDCDIVQNISKNKFAIPTTTYQPWIDFFTHEKMEHPICDVPRSKTSFLPSIHERRKVHTGICS